MGLRPTCQIPSLRAACGVAIHFQPTNRVQPLTSLQGRKPVAIHIYRQRSRLILLARRVSRYTPCLEIPSRSSLSWIMRIRLTLQRLKNPIGFYPPFTCLRLLRVSGFALTSLSQNNSQDCFVRQSRKSAVVRLGLTPMAHIGSHSPSCAARAGVAPQLIPVAHSSGISLLAMTRESETNDYIIRMTTLTQYSVITVRGTGAVCCMAIGKFNIRRCSR